MLKPNNYIIKSPQLEDSQNYGLLRETGLQHIEKLARAIWTDYNVHDPGITLLELLCYAITDLGYRTGYDIKDLLTEEIDGQPVNNSFFHTARDIFPTNPVSFSDLRKLLIDITGVKHAWISKNENVRYWLDPVEKRLQNAPEKPSYLACPPLNGLFDVLLEYEDFINTSNEGRIIRQGLLNAPDAGNSYQTPSGQGIQFRVLHPLVLRNIHVYAQGAAIDTDDNVVINIVRADESGDFNLPFATFSTKVSEANVKVGIPLMLELSPGSYRIDAQGSTVELLYTEAPPGDYSVITFPYYLMGVLALEQSFDGGTPNNPYYYFFDWELTFSVSPVEQETLMMAERVSTQMGPADPHELNAGTPVNVGVGSNIRMVFNALRPFTLHAFDVHCDAPGLITLFLEDKLNEEVAVRSDYRVTAGKNTIVLDWKIPAGLSYRLGARGQKDGGGALPIFRNSGVDIGTTPVYPVVLDEAVEIVHGINNMGNEKADDWFLFYNWQVSYQPCPPQITQITKQDIHLAVVDRLHRTRNLCQDFMHIRDLKIEKIGICADIELRPDADLVEVMAEIMYQMELYVSPPVNFYTIPELLEKGKTTDQIFEGPLLDHGFIDDEEFRTIERRCFLRASDIIQIIMDVEGVLAVKSILLISFIERTPETPVQPGDKVILLDGIEYLYKEEPWILHLQDQNFFAPDFAPERSKVFFYKKGLPYIANREKVLERLKEKRARQIRNKLKGHEQDLPVPVGEFKDLEDYYPIQNDLPETYFTGQNRVPKDRSNRRKAQSSQFKGYLLFFEQIFANYLSQLAHIKELFSWEKDAKKTYFTQKLKEIADLEKLYLPDYDTGLDDQLEEIIETPAVAQERKNRFLDHLIGRFCEDLTEYGLLMYSLFRKQAAQRLVLDKQAFLADYPRVSGERGKGFDYRFPELYENLNGYQRRIYRLLGIYDENCEVGRRNFSNPNFVITTVHIDGEERYVYQLLDEEGATVIFQSIDCQDREQICILLDNNIVFGADPANWLESAPDPDPPHPPRWELTRICRRGGETTQEILGYTMGISTADRTELEEKILPHFSEYANREGFHVVEHILLRKRTWESEEDFMPVEIHGKGEECDCIEVKDPYSFRASVILPSWPYRFRSIRFRQYVEELLRLEAPAHVYLKICWISHCEMQAFEACHDEWLTAHALLPRALRGETPLPKVENQVIPDTDPPEEEPPPPWAGQLSDYEEAFLNWHDQQHPKPTELKGYWSPLKRDEITLNEEEIDQALEYRRILQELIEKLHSLTNIFPTARLHDCDDIDSEEPQVTLNNTNLGSL